jgi:hypothetical protein
MTTREARGLSSAQLEEESVARYLQHNPDFFERHQALLARLRLPHARGGSTISLVERQVEVLRERHAAVEQKLADFVKVARSNDTVADKIHRFTRRLLRAGSRAAATASPVAVRCATRSGISCLEKTPTTSARLRSCRWVSMAPSGCSCSAARIAIAFILA